MKLLLFDIDGTILRTYGIGRRSVEHALHAVFGRSFDTQAVTFSGKTDPQIFHEVLAHHGIDARTLNGQMGEVLEAYQSHMRRLIDEDRVDVMPGVPALIAHLHAAPHVQMGLLTGNLEPMAYLKLARVGLDAYFPFGAFGSDHADRRRLPALAVERAARHTGRSFVRKDVVIIGDTEHDIACGRGIDAFSVGVCTGRYSRADLAPHTPDVLFDDLGDLPAFLRHVVDA